MRNSIDGLKVKMKISSYANYNSPAAAAIEFAKKSAFKNSLPFLKFALIAIAGGAFIAFGGLLTVVVVGNSPGLLESNPGLAKWLAGALFPVGLIMVSILGADLFTSDCAGATLAALDKKLSWRAVAKLLTISYVFNFFGAQLVAYFFAVKAGVISDTSFVYLSKYVDAKMNLPFDVVILKGIAANWLVCLGSYFGYTAKDVVGKCIGIWIPVMIFVALGYEHSIANMFFMPTAIYSGVNLSWGAFAIQNLIPATIGNLIGGCLFVGAFYWFIYLSKENKTL